MKYFKSLGEKTIGNEKKEFFKCNVCGAEINGGNNSNVSSHIQRVHPDIYQQFGPHKEHPAIKRLKLLQFLVELVSVNGRVLQSLLDSGFQGILEKKLNKLKNAGYPLYMHDGNLTDVKNHLHKMAEQVKEKIKAEVRGRAVCLQIDIVTKNNRSIFGAAIQYRVNGILKVRSIGMIELVKSHTAEYLAELIIARLKVYDISLKQILTITTDNGANVLKMVRDVDTILQTAISNAVEQTQNKSDTECANANVSLQMDDESIDDEINALVADDVTDEDAIGILYDDIMFRQQENLLSAMRVQMETEFGLDVLYDITGVKCSAHTLQLAIKDTLKKVQKKHSNLIALCRRVAKILRLSSIHHAVPIEYRSPRLDVDTRWGSTFMMVRLL